MRSRLRLAVIAAMAYVPFSGSGSAQVDLGKYSDFTPYQENWLTKEPAAPSDEWLIAYGGRLYDNWIEVLGKAVPAGNHPAYPTTGRARGPNTWRCKECHGWDYNGKDGGYGNPKSSHYTGIGGIRVFAGAEAAAVVKILRNRIHRLDSRLLPDVAAERLALFVTRGQIRIENHLAPDGTPKGNAARGKGIYQNICAVCHGFDGRSLNFGSASEPKYLGDVAAENPAELVHKVRNGHPGAIMPPQPWLDVQTIIDIASYARTLR